VAIDAVIDEHGNVTQAKVVSGNGLLVTAALNAVEQWKYQPTLLNGQPIAVDMEVTVTFKLGT
jgi:periplasmic protein TonB